MSRARFWPHGSPAEMRASMLDHAFAPWLPVEKREERGSVVFARKDDVHHAVLMTILAVHLSVFGDGRIVQSFLPRDVPFGGLGELFGRVLDFARVFAIGARRDVSFSLDFEQHRVDVLSQVLSQGPEGFRPFRNFHPTRGVLFGVYTFSVEVFDV